MEVYVICQMLFFILEKKRSFELEVKESKYLRLNTVNTLGKVPKHRISGEAGRRFVSAGLVLSLRTLRRSDIIIYHLTFCFDDLSCSPNEMLLMFISTYHTFHLTEYLP